MKKIISYSLFGSDPKYCYGILCNVEQSKIVYPGWICRIYYDNSVPENVISELSTKKNVELNDMSNFIWNNLDCQDNKKYHKMYWRFLPIDDDDVELMISRDADSRLSWREKKCVDIFIESDNLLHSIRDHLCHNDIMGGMWGIKKNNRIRIKEEIENFGIPQTDDDQLFLRYKLSPKFMDSYLIHCSCYLRTFPFEKTNSCFIGEVWSDDNQGQPKDYIWF
jgi:hypothetical protein